MVGMLRRLLKDIRGVKKVNYVKIRFHALKLIEVAMV
jgi:hypothetical protein